MLYIILIFCFVLLIYFHIQYQLKQSDEMEVLNIEYQNKKQLEKCLDIRQPCLISLNNIQSIQGIVNGLTRENMKVLNKQVDLHSDDLKIDRLNITQQIPIVDGFKKIDNKNLNNIITQNVEIQNDKKLLKSTSQLFKPELLYDTKCKYISGTEGKATNFVSEISNRVFLFSIEGECLIRLMVPTSLENNINTRELNYISNLDVSDKDSLNKYDIIEIYLKQDQLLYIPNGWWYSIEFGERNSVLLLRYYTYMNLLANMPLVFSKYIQDEFNHIRVNYIKSDEINNNVTYKAKTQVPELVV